MSKIKNDLTLTTYLEGLTLDGKFYFTVESVLKDLAIKRSSLSVSLSRLAAKGKVKMIRKGFGVITSQTRGVLDPSYFIDAMMNYLGSRYYVGLLSAASHWGASHQAVMQYCVVTDKVMKPVNLGRIKIVFVTKNNFDEITEVERVAGLGGYYNVSSPQLTVIDLVRFTKMGGYLNNVATVFEDLFDSVNLEKFGSICNKSSTPTVTLQRLGYLLDKVLGLKEAAQVVATALVKRKVARSVLSVANSEVGMKYSDLPFDEKWSLYKNTEVEPD